MNSATRLLNIVKILNSNFSKKFSVIFEEEYQLDISDQCRYLEFYLNINKEISKLNKDLQSINKIEKYKADIQKLYAVFGPNSVHISVNGVTNQTELGRIIVRLEVLEDLLEVSDKNIEILIEEDNFVSLLSEIDNLIEKIKIIDEEEYFDLISLLNNMKIAISDYKISGISSIESVLEKMYCKGLRIKMSDEFKDDINSVVGSMYNIWNISKKHFRKPIEYAKNNMN